MKKNFEMIFAREFLKRLKRLDRQNQIRMLKELKTLEENPRAGKQLVGRLIEFKSFRVGDYRIIYQISDRTIIIRTFDRKTVYENRRGISIPEGGSQFRIQPAALLLIFCSFSCLFLAFSRRKSKAYRFA